MKAVTGKQAGRKAGRPSEHGTGPRRTLRIVFVSEFFCPRLAGGEVWAWELCTELAKRGHHVTVLTLRHDKELPEEQTLSGIRILRIADTTPRTGNRLQRWLGLRRFMRKARRLIAALQPDLLHVMAYGLNVPVSQLAKKRGIPCVTSVHAFFGDDWRLLSKAGILLKAAERRSIGKDRSRIITVPSEYLRSRIRAETGRDTTVVHNWLPKRFPPPRKERTALFVGSLEPVKNPLACVQVAQHLGLPLTVIGDGTLRERLERDAAAAGVQCTVIRRLPREETLSYIGGASILLVPSVTESFSLAALEAVAQGTPVAGTAVGIIPELPGIVPFPPAHIPPRITPAQQAVLRRRFSRETAVDMIVACYGEALHG